MDLGVDDILFHDVEIHRVIENAESKDLGFQVMYPCGPENEDYERRTIVFGDVLNYLVMEGPCEGRPMILRVDQIGHHGDRGRLLIQTNFGDRLLLCRSVEVRPEWGAF